MACSSLTSSLLASNAHLKVAVSVATEALGSYALESGHFRTAASVSRLAVRAVFYLREHQVRHQQSPRGDVFCTHSPEGLRGCFSKSLSLAELSCGLAEQSACQLSPVLKGS